MIVGFDITVVQAALVLALSYLLGSVSFGIVMARLFGLGDLRNIGSGNIGATNVLRTGHKLAAGVTLLGDGFKGAFAVLLARVFLGESAAQLAALGAFFGHCFPIYLQFRGGKGVATFFGTLIALNWPIALGCAATWVATVALFRMSSLAALLAAISGPIWAVILGQTDRLVLMALLGALIFWRHKDNIKRILSGTESKIAFKK